jgi:hypothetical protein
MNAAKCSAIMSQPVSHNVETGAWLRLATAAKALANRVTAAKSGIFPQSTMETLSRYCFSVINL